MKKTLLIIFSYLSISLCSHAADEVAGFVHFAETPGQDTAPINDESRFVDLVLDEHAAFNGSITDANGSVITVSGAFWKPDEFVYTGTEQSRHFHVEIVTGSAAGSTFDIVSNSGNALTVDLAGGTLSALAPGDEVRVVSKWSLDLLFPNGNGLTPSTDLVDGTEIRFPISGPGGVDYTGAAVFLYRSDLGRWIDRSDPTTDVGFDPIQVGSLVSIRQPDTDPLSFLFSGYKSQTGSPLKLDVALVEEDVPDVPEITVEQPVNTDLTDGSASIDFGSVETGSNDQLTFTIRNTGTAELTGLSASIDGINQTEFVAGGLSATTLQPDESATFAVTFSPADTGVRTATLHIASNDADENPFDIALNGTGTAPPVVLDPPTNVMATDGGHEGEVRITWEASDGSTEYGIYRGAASDGSDAMLIGSTASTTFTDTTGNADEDYYYFVKAKNGDETSDFSPGEQGHHETATPSVPPTFQPDSLIGKKSSSLIGNNVYSTGSGQELKQKSKNRKKLNWYFGLQNDGNTADLFALSLTKDSKFFSIRLRSAAGANVTASAKTGALAETLAAGQASTYKLQVDPTKKADGKSKTQTFTLSVRSLNDSSKTDGARAKAQTK